MKKWLWLSVGVALGIYWYAKQKKEALPVFQTVQSFSLLDEENQPFTEKQIANRPCIVNFMFTQCQGTCPLLMERVAALARNPALAKVLFVSITMDTTNDRPEVLRAYMKEKQFEGLSWKFLTGEQSAVTTFATQALKVAAGEKPEMHSTRLILLDAKGQVRGYYESQEAAAMEKLQQDVLTLL